VSAGTRGAKQIATLPTVVAVSAPILAGAVSIQPRITSADASKSSPDPVSSP